jgi:hypothetical protein
MCAWSPSTLKAEAGLSLQVQDQPEQYSETQNQQQEQNFPTGLGKL